MKELDVVYAFGHENILCTHNTTIEITKDKVLTKKGNCILGINASKACIDLDTNLKNLIQDGKKIKVIIEVDGKNDYFIGFGNKNLTLLDKNDMVFRKSDFICDRTVLIRCNKASYEIDKGLIDKLKTTKKKLLIKFTAEEQ